MNIFVINLDRHPERLASIDQQLSALGRSYRRVSAVDGSKLSQAEIAKVYDPILCKGSLGRELARGEIGCAMSHLSICRLMVESQLPLAFVLEDDAQLSEELPQVLDALEYLGTEQQPVIVLLTHVGRYTAWGAKKLNNTNHQICKTVHAFCAHGYLINLAAARQLLSNNDLLESPIDYWNNWSAKGVVKVRAIVPYVVGHSSFAQQSDIESERMICSKAYELPLNKKIIRFLKSRFHDKLAYQLIKPFLRIRKQPQTF